jgi:hypothetical protein
MAPDRANVVVKSLSAEMIVNPWITAEPEISSSDAARRP